MVDDAVNLDISPALAVLDDLAARIGEVGQTGGQAMADAIAQRLAAVDASVPIVASDTDQFTSEIDRAVGDADGNVDVQVADAREVTQDVTDAVQSADTKVDVTGDTEPLVSGIDSALDSIDGKVPVEVSDPASLTAEVTDAVASADAQVQVSVADPGSITVDIQDAVSSANVQVPVQVADAAAITASLTAAIDAAQPTIDVKVADPGDITNTVEDALAAVDTTIDVGVDSTSGQRLQSTAAAASHLAESGKEATEAVGGLEVANIAMKASAAGAEGAIGELAETVGETLPRVAALTGGITAVAGVLTESVHAAAETADANRLMSSTFGEFKEEIEHIDLHGFNASLKEQTLAMGGNVAQVEIALSRYGGLAQQTGATNERTKEFVQNILLLTERAVALNPSLGTVEGQINRTGQAISRGGRFAQAFSVNLSDVEVQAEATREGFSGLVSELTPMEQQIVKVNAAAEQLGGRLGTDIQAGTESATVSFRRFKAELEEGLAAAGAPLLKPLQEALVDLTPTFQSLVVLIGEVARALLAAFGPALHDLLPVVSGVFGDLTASIGAVVPVFRVIGDVVGAVAGAFGGLTPVIRAFIGLGLADAAIKIGQAFLVMAREAAVGAAEFAAANPEFTAIAVLATAAAAAFGLFGGKAGDASKANDTLVDSLVKSTGVFNADTEAVLANAFAHDKSAAALRADESGLQELGISHALLIQAANGDAVAQQKLQAILDAAPSKYFLLRNAIADYLGMATNSAKAADEIIQTQRELAGSTDEATAAAQNRAAAIGLGADSELIYARNLDAAATAQANAAQAASFAAIENANQVAATQEAIDASREQDTALRDKIGVITDTTAAMTRLGVSGPAALDFIERAMERGTVSASDFADEARRLGVNVNDLEAVIPAAKAQFDAFTGAVSTAGKSAGDAFGGLSEAVKTATKDAGVSLDDFLQKLEDDLNAQATFADHLNELISRGFGDIAKVLETAGPEKGALAAAQAVQESDDQLREHQTALDETLDHQKASVDSYTERVKLHTGEQIQAWSDAQAAAEGAGSGIDAALLGAQSTLAAQTPAIVASVDSVGQSFDGLTPDAEGVRTGVGAALDAVSGPIDEKKDGIKTSADAVGATVQEGVVPAVADMLAAINAALDQIKQALTAQTSSVLATAVAVGDALSQGMAQGVSAGTGHVVAAAQQASQAAVEAAKAYAGIQSPSQLMADEVGRPLVEGIAVGIAGGAQSGGPIYQSMADAMNATVDVGKQLGPKGGELIGSSLAGGIADGISGGSDAAANAVADLADNAQQVSRLFGRDLGVNLTEDLAEAIKSGFFNVDNAVEDVILGAQRHAKDQLDQVFATLDAGQSLTAARTKLDDVKKQYDELLAQQLTDQQKFGAAELQLNAALADAQTITAREQQNIERAQATVAQIRAELDAQQAAATQLPEAQRQLALDQSELARLHGNLTEAQNNALLGSGTQTGVQQAQAAFTAQQQAVAKSQQAVDQLTAKMNDNRVSQNDLTVAQQDLAQAQADAVGPTDAVRQAQSNLKDIQDQSTQTAAALKDAIKAIPAAQLDLIKSTEVAALAGAEFNASAGAGVDVLKQLGEKAGLADDAIGKLITTWGGLPSQLATSLGGGGFGAPQGKVDLGFTAANGQRYFAPDEALNILNFIRGNAGQAPITQQQAPWNIQIFQANDPAVLAGTLASIQGLQAVR